MANPASGVTSAQHTAHVAQATPQPKQAAPRKSAAPEDKVSISNEGKAASASQAPSKPPQASGSGKK